MASVDVSRRQFLKGAGAAMVAGPTILSRSLWGAEAPSNQVGLALIGAGGRGNGLLGEHLQVPHARFVAVCDCYQDRRERLSNALNAHYGDTSVQAYADFREVLERDDVDAIIVATPDHWHVPIAMAASRAGKDMYVEKPLGVSMEWAWALREEIERSGVIFQYGTMQRSMEPFRRACELVRNGYIGNVERIEAWCPDISSQYEHFHVPRLGCTEPADPPEGFDYDMWLGPAPEAPYTVDRTTCFGAWHIYDYALGFIAGWGSHPLDIAQWGLDMDHTSPVHYEGTGSIPTEGLYDTIETWDVTCRYASGVTMRLTDHRIAQDMVTEYRPYLDHGTTFFGDEGWVSVDRGGGLHVSDERLHEVELKDDDVHLRDPATHAHDFVDSVRHRQPAIAPLEAAIRSDTISHLSDIAIRLGRSITWDPERERIIDDAEATVMLDRPTRPQWRHLVRNV